MKQGELNPAGTVRSKLRGGVGAGSRDGLVEALFELAEFHRVEPPVVWAGLEVARLAEGLDEREMLALEVLIVVSMLNQQEGSTLLPIDREEGGPLEAWLEELFEHADPEAGVFDGPEALREAIGDLLERDRATAVIGGPGEYRPFIWDGENLHHHQLGRYEERLAELFAERIAGGAEGFSQADFDDAFDDLDAAPPRLESGGPMQLNDEQVRALRASAEHGLTLISGGPGTGKTSVIVSILRLFARLGIEPERMALGAPTGKAANRLGEEIRRQLAAIEKLPDVDAGLRDNLRDPETLHRLLGYSPSSDRFHFDEQNPLSAKLVVIDEASMIDVYLMRQLVGAIPGDARFVLVGDADQLPSVENGAVFRDLIPEDESAPTASSAVRLEHNYRMEAGDPAGAEILEAAQALNDGRVTGKIDGATGDEVPDLPASGVQHVDRLDGDFLEAWFRTFYSPANAFEALSIEERAGAFQPEDLARLDATFDGIEGAQILSLTRVLDTGTDAINAYMHRRYRTAAGTRSRSPFLVGEPVMMLRNDYELGLYNGDRGLVCRVDRGEGPQMAVAFRTRDGFRAVDLGRIRDDIRHSYAITVHKSQGSEFEHVALVLPNRDISILTREILYTGLTRASRSVVILGSVSLLERGAGRKLRRHTGVTEKLRAAANRG